MRAERTLVALGDSIVSGWGVGDAESYPSLIEAWLNEAGPGKAWRVVNAGVPGDTTVMGCQRYARDVQPFAPDVVLLAFGLNDGALRRTQFDAQREQLWRAAHHPAERLALVAKRWVVAALKRIGDDKARSPEVQRLAAPRVGSEFFVRALSDLTRRAHSDRAQVLFVPLAPVASPALATVAQMRMPEAQWESYCQFDHLIAKLARREQLPLVDLSTDPQPERPTEMLADDGVHMTASGQWWLATCVYATLRGMIEPYAGPDIDH